MYDFSSVSNRLMQADFQDYNAVLNKFLNFVDATALIHDYIKSCGECSLELDEEVKQVQGAYGNAIFELGESDDEEIRNVYAILKYIIDHDIDIHYGLAMGYAHSNHFQDMVKGFNERVVFVLIRHIDRYLTKIGIEMGMDERNTYNITVENGQVNIANDNSSLFAHNTVAATQDELVRLIQDIRVLLEQQDLSEEDEDTLNSSLDVISEEMKESKPRASFLKTAVNGIKMVKGTAEFGAAIVALIQFIQPFIQ